MTRQTVALVGGRPVWVDALEVARMAAGERDDDELLAAVQLCRGEFLGHDASRSELSGSRSSW